MARKDAFCPLHLLLAFRVRFDNQVTVSGDEGASVCPPLPQTHLLSDLFNPVTPFFVSALETPCGFDYLLID